MQNNSKKLNNQKQRVLRKSTLFFIAFAKMSVQILVEFPKKSANRPIRWENGFFFGGRMVKLMQGKRLFYTPKKKAVLPVGAHSRAADMPEETI